MVHVRFEGRSFDLTEREIPNVAGLQDEQLMVLLARQLDVQRDRLKHYVIDRRPTGTVIVRPEAVYG